MAIVVAPRRAADIVASQSPDLITVPCNSTFPDPALVQEVSADADALVLGCGVARTRPAHRALLSILNDSHIPTVVDAEALHAIAEDSSGIKGKKLLLTPNAGEFQVLSGASWPESSARRKEVIRTVARRYRSTVIVKGALDFISDGVKLAVDREGSPYLTKGGYGDLLAGSAAAFLARGHTPFDAARYAAYLIGSAGKMAAKEHGEATLASDTLRMLPKVVGRIRGGRTS